MSAPFLSMIFSGFITLPSDFDIFCPSGPMMKPCVRTVRYGAVPRVATLLSSEVWNQPRCWSLPSRYMSAGQLRSSQLSSTAEWLVPESNQTSIMSESLRRWVCPHFGQTARSPMSSSGVIVHQQLLPCSRILSATRRTRSPVRMTSPQSSQ